MGFVYTGHVVQAAKTEDMMARDLAGSDDDTDSDDSGSGAESDNSTRSSRSARTASPTPAPAPAPAQPAARPKQKKEVLRPLGMVQAERRVKEELEKRRLARNELDADGVEKTTLTFTRDEGEKSYALDRQDEREVVDIISRPRGTIEQNFARGLSEDNTCTTEGCAKRRLFGQMTCARHLP